MENGFTEETGSLCPVCLKRIMATRVSEGDDVFMVKECPEHGFFRTILWRGKPSMATWQRPKDPVRAHICYGSVEKGCPFDCGLCEDHLQLPCSVLIEVTDQCNLNCPVCFADSGKRSMGKPTMERIAWLLERSIAAAGPTNIQLSGGEPTLREDLPRIVETAQRVGYSFIQVNSNGLRLASDRAYVEELAAAGLSSVFLQFDGVTDDVYCSLRGKALLERKSQAVKNCGEVGIGVVLVPTLVKGINTDSVGAIVQQALHMAPTVRGVHFQPLSYFGRFPGQASDEGRITLPELMRCLEEQTDGLVKVADFSPPGCEHAYCSFHASYIRMAGNKLRLLGEGSGDGCCSVADYGGGGVRKTVEAVSQRWTLPLPVPAGDQRTFLPQVPCCEAGSADEADWGEAVDLDHFLEGIATGGSFTLSAMAFQDAENLDLERLRGCCISVISHDGSLVPFCAYNLTSREGKGLYRGRRRSELR